jgi:hypothetical protein
MGLQSLPKSGRRRTVDHDRRDLSHVTSLDVFDHASDPSAIGPAVEHYAHA